MSDRIDLSADTWIDGEYLVTTDHEKAAVWIEVPYRDDCEGPEGRWIEPGETDIEWDTLDYLTFGAYSEYRIPRATARERYQYVEGEPGAWMTTGFIAGDVVVLSPCAKRVRDFRRVIKLHRRAALVCDTAEQFRALHEWIMEAPHA